MKLKRTKISVSIFCLVIGVSLFLSCRRNSPSWDTQVLAPIITTNLSINNIITSSYLKNNPDSSVSLVYTDSLYALNMDTLLTIPDTVLSYKDSLPIPSYTATPGSLLFSTAPTTTTYPIGSVELTKGILQSGFLIFTVTNQLSQPMDYCYQVSNVTKNGSPLSIYVKVPANTSITKQIPLGGYNVDFRGPTSNGYNDITTSIQVNLDSTAAPLTILQNQVFVSANITFSKIIPYYVQGYFGTTTRTFGPENVKFPVFNKITSGTLNLQNVSVTLTLINGFGVNTFLILSQLSSYNSHTNTTVNLVDNNVVNSTITVNAAQFSHNPPPASPVIPYIETFNINPSNSNILTWLNNMPTSVGYKLQVITDPSVIGNQGFSDFAYYGYGVNANLNVTIPLSLVANNLTLADTLSVNFAGSSGTTEHIKSGTLTLYANNGFPFSAGLQLYLVNANNVISDSLFVPSQSIAAAPVNTAGIVTGLKSSVLTISLNATQAQQLYGSKKIILHAIFNMGSISPLTYIKIYDYYQLGLKLVGNFDYQIN